MTAIIPQDLNGPSIPLTEQPRPGSAAALDRSAMLTRLHPEFGRFLSAHTVAAVLDRQVSDCAAPEEAEERCRRELAEILADS